MKKTLLILAVLLCNCFALKAQELMPLNAYSPVGELGTIGGREAIVVDLGGSIGKVAVATKNIGATDDNPYGTEFNSKEAFDTSVTGLTYGWYAPSAAELEALMGHLQANQAFTGLEWNVTQTSALQFPGYKLDDDILEMYIGSYASSDKRQVGGNWYFSDLEFQITAGYDLAPAITIYIDPEVDQAAFQCVIRPFHQLPAPENNEIWYTSANHEVVTPHASDVFDATIQSNVYDAELDQGIISFDGDVTRIGDRAFFNCTSLTSIIIPNSVTSIGKYALELCTGMTSINIPSSVTSIGWAAFDYCTSLTSIAIPENVTFIDGFAFSNCSSLTSINIPDNVTSIEKYTFNSCPSLTSIAIPSNVTSIGESAFSGCSGLTSISLPNGLLSLEAHSFSDCTGLTSITIPSSLLSLESHSFSNCTGLTSITIPSSVTSIGDYAFSGCSGLTSISLPNSLLSLGANSFSNCSGLTSFTIPSSVTSIGNSILSSCSSLQSVAVESGNTVYDSRENCNAIIETATNTMIAGFAITTFPPSVTAIGNYAFSGCMNLTSMTIPSTVTKLGDYAFSGCSNLVSTTIPSSVTSIGGFAFHRCSGLESAILQYGVTSIGDHAFDGCKSLTSISLPNSLLNLGAYSFSNCTGLTSITIPNGSIGEWAFEGCSGLKSVTLQDGVTSIGSHAFSDCSGLTSISLPNTPLSLGDYSFSKCTGLTSITIPSSVTSIGGHAFSGCSGLTSIDLPNGLLSLETGSFNNCTGLTSITIPSSVTSIGSFAFYRCSGLESVILQEGVKSIGDLAFSGCAGLTFITIPSSVTSIGIWTFSDCNFANIISKATTAPTLASIIPDASNNVYIPTGALQSYQDKWGGFRYYFIEQDMDACTFNGNSSNAWSDASNWEENAVPTKNCPSVFINADCQMDADAEIGLVTVAAGMTLTVGTEKTLKPDGITLENGAQLFNNGTVSSSNLTVKKDITGYGKGSGNWHLVSSPVATTSLPVGMATTPAENYDLYRFSQTGDEENKEWLNYKAESFGIENQSGYLYANKNGTTILFRGGFAATNAKPLAYDADADFPGFNLVGNPYPCNATISGTGLRSSNYFYKMNADGTDLEVVAEPVLAPCTGVFAVAANDQATVTFTPTTANANVTRGEKSSLQDIRVELLANGKVIDRAYLNMNGESLPKFSLQDNISEICFYQDK